MLADFLVTVSKHMIVYVNGDSYAVASDGKTYADFLGDYFNCTVVNSALSGSSNSRIFRTSLRDLMSLSKLHKNIVAVISLTFPVRTEIWDQDIINNRFVNDGEFVSVQAATSKNWFHDRSTIPKSKYSNYINQWLNWYNVEAETTILLKEILLLTTWCKYNKIDYVIFSGPLQEPVDFQSAFIKSYYDAVLEDPNFINIFEDSFTQWCIRHGHVPIDNFTQEIHGQTYIIGHHGESAHKDFATFLFKNYIGPT
jgi:hypothetical protein